MTAPSEERQRDHNLRALARGASLGLVGKVYRNGALYLFAVAAARILGSEQFGVYLLALGIVTVSAQLCMLGLDRGLVRDVALYARQDAPARVKGALQAALGMGMAAAAVAAIVLLATSVSLGRDLYHKPQMVMPLRLITLALPLQVFTLIATAATRGAHVMRYTTLAEDVIQPTLNLLLLGGLAAVFASELGAASAAYVASFLVTALVAAAFLDRVYPVLRSAVTPERHTLALLRSSAPLGLVAMGGWLYAWISTLVLGVFADTTEVAVFQAALRTAMLLAFLAMPFNLMVAPILADLHGRGQQEEARAVLRTASRWVFAAGLPVMLSMMLFSADWLALFGPEFRQGALVLMILAAATFVNGCFGPSFWLLQMTGRGLFAMTCTLVFVGSQAAIAAALTPRSGAMGACVATAVSVVLFDALVVAGTHRLLHSHPFARPLLKPLLAAAVACVCGLTLRSGLEYLGGTPALARLGAGTLWILGVYLGTYGALGFEEEDRRLWASATASLRRFSPDGEA